MTPIETDFEPEGPEEPVGPVGTLDSGSSGRRRRKPSGGGQAIAMILSWVGGAGAAVAVAFYILQYVKPPQDPNDPNNSGRTAVVTPEATPRPKRRRTKPDRTDRTKPDRTTPKLATDPIDSSAAVNRDPTKPVNGRENFQPPEMPGLAYRYYEGETFGMANFSTATPSRSGVVIDVGDLPPAKLAKGLQLEGTWKTQTEQACDFVLDSTNGAKLYIDDQLVLDNTAQFERKPVEAQRTIKPGMHVVRVDFVLSTERGRYELAVGAAGDRNRMDLARLLQPFGTEKLTSLQKLQYRLAKYEKPDLATRALIASNREAAEAGLVETVAATPIGDSKASKTILPEGKLLAGLALSSSNGRVTAATSIYLDSSGLSLGERMGKRSGEWEAVIAKPGFAVSAVQIGRSALADKVSLEFRKIDEKSLLSTGAYTQSFASSPVPISVDDEIQPVIGLRVYTSANSSLLGIDAMRVRSGGDRMLTVLVDGFPRKSDLRKAPSASKATKKMKKMMKESMARLEGQKGAALEMELNALAASTASAARISTDDEDRFVGLLEARRLYLLAEKFERSFAITDELSQEFEYDYWKDLLAFYADATKRAGKNRSSQLKVIREIEQAMVKAEDSYQFEVAGRLAVGGKMLATAVEDQRMFERFNSQLEELAQNASVTKQARVAAKTLTSRPDDPKANRVMGVFALVVTDNWSEAMKYFARSSSEDYEFIAKHDRSFDGSDAEVAVELADCWKRIGKKNGPLEKLATGRAQKVLMKARQQAQGEALQKIDNDLEKL